ncbi:MAG: pyruvate dehydrogenase (acetyl-transferring), homodimeric type [Microthrixaceae bacterium]
MIIDGFAHQLPDIDPEETAEWLDSFESVVDNRGRPRARYLMARLVERSRQLAVGTPETVSTPYVNTIPPEDEPWFPGDWEMERHIRAYIRWNAAVMVVRGNKRADGLGGHLSTFASSAALYDVGFNHFFRGKDGGQPGDHIYIQGHASPGIYARAFLEGRLSEADLDRFRREVDPPKGNPPSDGRGLPSYPHPHLMGDFWEYPTVSMGLGPILSIYQAHFNKYLQNREIDDGLSSRVWGFLGDGEVDEPETLGAISLAAREHLDNLTWVINCNLQRLDGPVRGNGKIIQELEAIFRGSGWNVIKVIWGAPWDDLLARDVDGVLLNKMNSTLDGEFQRYTIENGAYIREHFFGPDPRLRKMVEHLSDAELQSLPRGGHDYRKLYAAYDVAVRTKDVPTVILAQTIKGWSLGAGFEGRNSTHQIKKMNKAQLLEFRDRLHLGDVLPDSAFDGELPPYVRPPEGSPVAEYLMQRRRQLGGHLPSREVRVRRPLALPSDSAFDEFMAGSGTQAASTTTSFTRLLRNLCRDPQAGARVVPIIPDEARTFGMDALFPEFKIYSALGQNYEPVDHDLLLSYKEAIDGQILEEGITEAGSMAAWTAAATSYLHRGVPMLPFFTYYSMFGFQRMGDLVWAAGDAGARGFMMAATAGRTTLTGEGLQHCDGHSHVLMSVLPNCRAYDPAFAYETALIVKAGIHEMFPDGDPTNGRDVIYYLTLYNENYPMPPTPTVENLAEKVIKGLYRYADAPEVDGPRATILFSGTAHVEATKAVQILASDYSVGAELWSATSYQQMRREALSVERHNRLHPDGQRRTPWLATQLASAAGPITAVTDFMHSVPDEIARWVPRRFNSLGTDGFGRSDTRESLRSFFETDARNIVLSVLSNLVDEGEMKPEVLGEAIKRMGIATDVGAPWEL